MLVSGCSIVVICHYYRISDVSLNIDRPAQSCSAVTEAGKQAVERRKTSLKLMLVYLKYNIMVLLTFKVYIDIRHRLQYPFIVCYSTLSRLLDEYVFSLHGIYMLSICFPTQTNSPK